MTNTNREISEIELGSTRHMFVTTGKYSTSTNFIYITLIASVQLRKTSVQTKEPQENGAKETFFQKPTLKPVPQREKSPPKKDHKIHNLPTLQKVSDRVLKDLPRKSSQYQEETSSSDEYDEDDDEVEIDKVIIIFICLSKQYFIVEK